MDDLIIIKVGGALIQNAKARRLLLQKFSAMQGPRILVHGGGREASDMLESLGITPAFHEGRRITDKATLDVVTMVYAGKVNKGIVSELQAMGINAIGLSGADGNIITAEKRPAGDVDFGYVGNPVAVDTKVVNGLLEISLIPVICPLTHDGKGQLFNTNADTMASVMAVAMSSLYRVSLRFCFEFNGVLRNIDEPKSVITKLDHRSIEQAKDDGLISGGMLPKVENALKASQNGVSEVVICGIENLSDPSRATSFYG